MFNNESTHWIKVEAIIIDLIVASLIVLGLIGGVKLIFGKQIKSAIEVIDMVSISTDSNAISEIKFDKEVQEIKEYPEYGTRYANIKIESIDVNLPLYYGDKLSILKNGARTIKWSILSW